MKKIISLVLISFLTAPPVRAELNTGSLNQETWANWGKRLQRAYADIKPRKMPGRSMGILVPGDPRPDLLPLAAIGYDLLSVDRALTYIILVPAPDGMTSEGLVVTNLEYLDTSIGSFAIDNFLMSQFKEGGLPITIDNGAFFPAMSMELETQLASLKFILGPRLASVKILPIYVRLTDVNSQVKDLAPILAETIKDNDLTQDVSFVVVGDLTRTENEAALTASDSGMLNAVRNLDVDALIETAEKQLPEGPASHPDLNTIALGILTLKWLGADHGEIMAYAHSSQMVLTKNKNQLTSFVVAGVASDHSIPSRLPHINRESMEETFDELLRADLLTVARQTAASILDATAAKPPGLVARDAAKPWPVYISIYTPDGKLAGQAGSHYAVGPLEESIRRFTVDAVKAAGNLTKESFKNYVVDVSVPYGFTKISRPEDLIPYLNGIIVERAQKKSAFHPDSWRQYPDPHQLLASISTKLRLQPWAYATRQSSLESFRVLSFNEKEPFQSIENPKRKKKNKGKTTDPFEDVTGGDDTGGEDTFGF